jgi:hypothetical protein
MFAHCKLIRGRVVSLHGRPRHEVVSTDPDGLYVDLRPDDSGQIIIVGHAEWGRADTEALLPDWQIVSIDEMPPTADADADAIERINRRGFRDVRLVRRA